MGAGTGSRSVSVETALCGLAGPGLTPLSGGRGFAPSSRKTAAGLEPKALEVVESDARRLWRPCRRHAMSFWAADRDMKTICAVLEKNPKGRGGAQRHRSGNPVPEVPDLARERSIQDLEVVAGFYGPEPGRSGLSRMHEPGRATPGVRLFLWRIAVASQD
ncbi:MAG: hypothetical protein ACLU9S_11805 [Oscillospiraceae bacterium]